jgi:hypothetical protein
MGFFETLFFGKVSKRITVSTKWVGPARVKMTLLLGQKHGIPRIAIKQSVFAWVGGGVNYTIFEKEEALALIAGLHEMENDLATVTPIDAGCEASGGCDETSNR